MLGWPYGLCWPLTYVAFWPMLTSKVIGAWIHWPHIQILFKFQVIQMKFEDFRKIGSNWPIGLWRPFWSTEFYETSMRDRRRVGDINLWKFQNDWLCGLGWRWVDRQTNQQTNEKSLIEWQLGKTAQSRMALGRAHTSARWNSSRFVSHWWAGSEPKSNPLVVVTYSTHPPCFVITRPQLFET